MKFPVPTLVVWFFGNAFLLLGGYQHFSHITLPFRHIRFEFILKMNRFTWAFRIRSLKV